MIIDFIQCTFPDGISLQQVKDFLPKADWVELTHGSMGYRRSVSSGDIRLLYDGSKGMGIHLVVSGNGCRQLEGAGLTDWQEWLNLLIGSGVHFTRFDGAIDDKAGLIDLGQVWKSIQEGSISTHCQTFRQIESINTRKGQPGRTVYIGSTKSEVQMRMYDKAAEQGQAEEEGTWVRVELQTRGKSADTVVRVFIQQGAPVISQVIAGFIQFKEPNTDDSRRDRWQVASWWAEFLRYAEKLSLSVQPMKKTLAEVKEWCMRQVAPTLALMVRAAGGNYGDILELVDNGMERLSRKHLAIIAGIG